MMTKLMRAAVMAAGAVLSPAAALAATVPDGSFENHSVNGNYEYNPADPGVTFTNHAGIAATNNFGIATAADGGQFGIIQNTDSAGSVAFALSDLIAGHSYNVGFYLARGANVPVDPLQVRLNGTLLQNSANGQTLFVAPAGGAWTQFTTAGFVAGASTATLSFTGTAELGGNFEVGLDEVTLTDVNAPVAVPEVATWAMMVGGFGLTGAALRRRRRGVAFA